MSEKTPSSPQNHQNPKPDGLTVVAVSKPYGLTGAAVSKPKKLLQVLI